MVDGRFGWTLDVFVEFRDIGYLVFVTPSHHILQYLRDFPLPVLYCTMSCWGNVSSIFYSENGTAFG